MSGNFKYSFICFIIVLIGYILFNQQEFVCDKTQDICYSTMSGIKVGESFNLSDIKSVSIRQSDKRVRNTHHVVREKIRYTPVVITKNDVIYPFYVSNSIDEAQANQDAQMFSAFLKSNLKQLKLNNKRYFLIFG